MRDIDQVLAKAHARRAGLTEPTNVPPPPHFPIEPDPNNSATSPTRPHLVVPPQRATEETNLPDPFAHEYRLQWPSTVLAIERAHGARFEALADRLILARDQNRERVLLFTSCHRAEGRTTLVLTLARALAKRPGRTLLVDADLTGPMLARSLGLRPSVGLDDVIEDGVPLSEAILDASGDHLSILPLRAPVARPRDFLASPEWSVTLAKLRRDFDLVLIDGSPIFAGLTATILHRSVDAAILVQSRALTGERALLRAREVLDAGGIRLLGVAETFA